MTEIKRFRPNEILPMVGKNKTFDYVNIDGTVYTVTLGGIRLTCFARSQKCVSCGIIGSLFILEKCCTQKPHLNFYAEVDGGLRLMTRDHIVPRSAGGANTLENQQTMCAICNNLKGSRCEL